MLDKDRLGKRYVCYSCGTKFYDLNSAIPTCPECQTDQREAPVRDIKSLLSKGGARRKNEPDVDEEVDDELDDEVGVDEDGEEEEDDLGLLGDDEEDEGGGGEDLD